MAGKRTAAGGSSSLLLGPQFDIDTEADSFDEWKCKWRAFEDVSGLLDITDLAKRKRKTLNCLINCFTKSTVKILKTCNPESDGVPSDPDTAISLLEAHIKEGSNSAVWRYHFLSRHQKEGESAKDWVNDLHMLIKKCNFEAEDPSKFVQNRLKDQLMLGVRDERARKKMWREDPGLTLERALQICQGTDADKSREENCSEDWNDHELREAAEPNDKASQERRQLPARNSPERSASEVSSSDEEAARLAPVGLLLETTPDGKTSISKPSTSSQDDSSVPAKKRKLHPADSEIPLLRDARIKHESCKRVFMRFNMLAHARFFCPLSVRCWEYLKQSAAQPMDPGMEGTGTFKKSVHTSAMSCCPYASATKHCFVVDDLAFVSNEDGILHCGFVKPQVTVKAKEVLDGCHLLPQKASEDNGTARQSPRQRYKCGHPVLSTVLEDSVSTFEKFVVHPMRNTFLLQGPGYLAVINREDLSLRRVLYWKNSFSDGSVTVVENLFEMVLPRANPYISLEKSLPTRHYVINFFKEDGSVSTTIELPWREGSGCHSICVDDKQGTLFYTSCSKVILMDIASKNVVWTDELPDGTTSVLSTFLSEGTFCGAIFSDSSKDSLSCRLWQNKITRGLEGKSSRLNATRDYDVQLDVPPGSRCKNIVAQFAEGPYVCILFKCDGPCEGRLWVIKVSEDLGTVSTKECAFHRHLKQLGGVLETVRFVGILAEMGDLLGTYVKRDSTGQKLFTYDLSHNLSHWSTAPLMSCLRERTRIWEGAVYQPTYRTVRRNEKEDDDSYYVPRRPVGIAVFGSSYRNELVPKRRRTATERTFKRAAEVYLLSDMYRM